MNESESDDEYDFAPTRPAPPPRTVPSSVPVTLAYQTAAKVDPTAPAEPETIKNLYMPLWLLCGGVVIEGVSAFWFSRNAQEALFELGVGLIGGTVLMLIGVLIAARIRQIDLGNFWNAVFKLAAVCIAPTAVGTLLFPLGHLPFGGLLILIVEFALYFALLGALFDLDQSDTWYCVMVIFLVHLAIYFTLKTITGSWA